MSRLAGVVDTTSDAKKKVFFLLRAFFVKNHYFLIDMFIKKNIIKFT